MKITTQLHINRLVEKLPYSILDLIKSFLFYDTKTYKIIENTKLNKGKMLYIINNITLSRANNFDDHSDYSDNLEHWAFGYFPNEKICMQAVNCYYCGNYISHSKDDDLFSHNIYCKCDIEDDFLDNSSFSNNSLLSENDELLNNIEDEIVLYMDSLLLE